MNNSLQAIWLIYSALYTTLQQFLAPKFKIMGLDSWSLFLEIQQGQKGYDDLYSSTPAWNCSIHAAINVLYPSKSLQVISFQSVAFKCNMVQMLT
jgi:hypothetical protein